MGREHFNILTDLQINPEIVVNFDYIVFFCHISGIMISAHLCNSLLIYII